MSKESVQAILEVLQQSPEPLGWHGIAMRLGQRGVIIGGNLVLLLRELEQQGLLLHGQATGHPHGVYTLTELGRRQIDAR